MTRMSHEAEPEEIDGCLLNLAHAIHSEVCGCDDKRCPVTGAIYDWLEAGDRGEGRTAADLAAEWREYDETEE